MIINAILISAGVSAVISFLTSVAVLKLGLRFKLYPAIRARDVHTRPTPRLGGIAMYVGLLAGLFTAYQFKQLRSLIFEENQQLFPYLLLAVTIIILVGVLDDLLDLHWSLKITGELIATATVVLFGGFQLNQLPIGSLSVFITSNTTSIFLTILITLVVINMMNFIDGLDGLVAGIAIIANATYFAYIFLLSQQSHSDNIFGFGLLFSALACAICAGFLVLNWHPAKLFMGDSGSMLVGLLFALTAINVTSNIDPTQFFATGSGHYLRSNFAPAFLPLLLPVAVIIVPLLDFGLAILRRLLAGKSPFTADRKHLHHRLLDMGHRHFHATLILYAVTAVISFGSLLFYLESNAVYGWSFILGGLMLCASITLLPLSRRKKQEQDTQTRPVALITPEMAALDRLDKASMRQK